MDASLACQYVIVKFVPDEIRGEPFNIGVILNCPVAKEVESRFLTSFGRLEKLLERPQVKSLKFMLDNLRLSLDRTPYDEKLLERFSERAQGQLQFSEVRTTLTTDLLLEVDVLYERYVSLEETIKEERGRVTKATLISKINSAFEQVGIEVGLDKPVKTGFEAGNVDKFRYDYAWHNGHFNFIHTLSFDVEESYAMEQSRLLALAIVDTSKAQQYKQSSYSIVFQPPRDGKEGYEIAHRLLREVGGRKVKFKIEDKGIKELVQEVRHDISAE